MSESLTCQCVSGHISVICGPMCAEKTQELIRRLTRAEIAGIPSFVFKPARGRQKDDDLVKSRSGGSMKALTLCDNSALQAIPEIEKIGRPCAVGFDEAHWISDLKDACSELADKGHLVYVAGLDMDYQGEPYYEICMVMGIAETVDKLTAVSIGCGCPATHTCRLGDGNDEGGAWEPRCRNRWREARLRSL